MHKTILVILAALTAGALYVAPAHAQTQTAYVAASSAVVPSATCTIAAPCTTITNGIAAVNSGGEVIILDSATYAESINLTKTVVITAPNTPIIVPPLGSSAFNLATAGVTLSLSGVIIDGQGGTASGISVTNGRNLFVSNSSIRNFNGGGVIAGIYVKPISGVTINMFVTGTSTSGDTFGIVADGTAGGIIRGSIRSSLVSVNTNNGITVSTSGSGSAVLLLHQVLVQGNGIGLAGGGTGAGMLVDDSRIFGNTTGISAASGSSILSYGNNDLNANNADGAFTANVGLR